MSEATTKQQHRRLPLLALAALVLLAGAAGLLWQRFQSPPVPEVPLTDLNPEVTALIEKARAQVVREPRSASAWGTLGRTLLANELYSEISLVCFQEAERLDPSEPRWLYLGAGVLLNLSRPADAEPKLRLALERCQQAGVAATMPRLLLAETLIELNQPEEAETLFRQVLRTEPNQPRALFGLAVLLSTRGEWQECRSLLEKCLSSPEARKKACSRLAFVCEQLADRDNATLYARLAERLPADFDWSDPFLAEHEHLARRKRDRYRVVERLEAEGQFARAAEMLAPLVEKYPDDDLPHLMMGRLLAQLGQFEAAEVHLQKCRQLAPDKVQPDYLLALVHYRRGETLSQDSEANRQQARTHFEASASAARQALQRRPDYGFAHMALGLALKQLDQREEAIAAFRQAVHCSPEHLDNHYLLGLTLAEDGKLREARRHLEQARLLAGPNDSRPATALKQYFPDQDDSSKR